jgi:hypothetical protein
MTPSHSSQGGYRLKSPLRARNLSQNSRVMLAGEVHRPGEGLEQAFDHVMRFTPIQQLQMEVALRLVGEPLEELPRQPKPEGRRHVLVLVLDRDAALGMMVHSFPDQIGSPAEIDHAPRQALVHRHVGLTREGIPRIEARSVPPQAPLVPQRFPECLPQGNPAVLDRVVRVHFQIPLAGQLQITGRMLRHQGQHVVEKRDSRLHLRLARAVDPQIERDRCLLGHALQARPPFTHGRTGYPTPGRKANAFCFQGPNPNFPTSSH